MNNQTQSPEGKTKNITFSLVFSWLFGIFVGIPAIMTFFNGKVGIGLLLLATALIVFPPTDKLIKQKLHVALSRGLKIAIVIIVLIVLGSVSMKSDSINTPTSVKTTNTQQDDMSVEAIKVTAIKLAQSYIDNEVSADMQYKGKMLEISGTIDDIGKDILNDPYVVLDGQPSDYFTNVQCMFAKSDETKLANLKKGMSLALRGVNSGKLGNVILRQCSIVE